MRQADGDTTAAARLAEAVLAATPSALLPETLARVNDVRVAGSALRVALTVDGRPYVYDWPEEGTLAQAIDGAPPETWATTVLANLAETLEAADRGLAWALKHGVIRTA